MKKYEKYFVIINMILQNNENLVKMRLKKIYYLLILNDKTIRLGAQYSLISRKFT